MTYHLASHYRSARQTKRVISTLASTRGIYRQSGHSTSMMRNTIPYFFWRVRQYFFSTMRHGTGNRVNLTILILPNIRLRIQRFRLLTIPLRNRPNTVNFNTRRLVGSIINRGTTPTIRNGSLIPHLRTNLTTRNVILGKVSNLTNSNSFLYYRGGSRRRGTRRRVRRNAYRRRGHALPCQYLIRESTNTLLQQSEIFILYFPFITNHFNLLTLKTFLTLRHRVTTCQRYARTMLNTLMGFLPRDQPRTSKGLISLGTTRLYRNGIPRFVGNSRDTRRSRYNSRNSGG